MDGYQSCFSIKRKTSLVQHIRIDSIEIFSIIFKLFIDIRFEKIFMVYAKQMT